MALLALLAVDAGCAAILGGKAGILDDDTDGGADATAESSARQGDANGVDAPGQDGASSDASDASEAASDASDAPSEAAPEAGRYCTTVSVPFCDDFDDVDSGFPHWDSVKLDGDASAGRETANYTSSPTSARFTNYGNSSETYKTVGAGDVSTIHVAFDLVVATRGQYVEIKPIKILRSDGTENQLLFRVRALGAQPTALRAEARFTDGGALDQDLSPLAGSPNFSAWTHVDLTLDLTAHSVDVKINGMAGSMQLDTSAFGPGAAIIQAGISYSDVGDSWSVLVDNFTADWQ